jgi:uncharacterized membrane protein
MNESPDRNGLRASLGWQSKSNSNIINESEMARSWECRDQLAQKVIDTADVVREAIFRQLCPLANHPQSEM